MKIFNSKKVKKLVSEEVCRKVISALNVPKLTNGERPSLDKLNKALRDLESIKLNIKQLGYELARYNNIEPLEELPSGLPDAVPLSSKLTTQKDMESEWVRYWCRKMHIKPIYHRKLWEFCFFLQALHENLEIENALDGIGFGCGEEPLASVLCSFGHKVTVTDLSPEKVRNLGWVETNQHTDSLEKSFYSDIITRETFYDLARLEYVDMNDVPSSLHGHYDYCYSICALEHLGSIRKGLDFVINSTKCLKPGGVAIHTTEFNFTNHPEEIDHWPTVIFKEKHMSQLFQELEDEGCTALPLNLDFSTGILDRFIDIPPYSLDDGNIYNNDPFDQKVHLKLNVDGFPCTCIGIIVKKLA